MGEVREHRRGRNQSGENDPRIKESYRNYSRPFFMKEGMGVLDVLTFTTHHQFRTRQSLKTIRSNPNSPKYAGIIERADYDWNEVCVLLDEDADLLYLSDEAENTDEDFDLGEEQPAQEELVNDKAENEEEKDGKEEPKEPEEPEGKNDKK